MGDLLKEIYPAWHGIINRALIRDEAGSIGGAAAVVEDYNDICTRVEYVM